MKKYIAECFGTFGLTLVVGLSLTGSFPIPTPILAAVTLGLFVYTIGHISGTHINPAVTVGLWVMGKISHMQAVFYIIAQLVGAVLAAWLIRISGLVIPAVSGDQFNMVILAEGVGTFFFTFGIASTIYGKIAADIKGIVIGGSLLLGISIAVFLGSGGLLNPAIALGVDSFTPGYIIGPVIGSVCAMAVSRWLNGHISS